MKPFDFNPFGNESIILSFDCDVCGHYVESEEINIPYPDYSAETARESQAEEEGYAICESCEKQFDISLFVTYAGGYGNIEELQEAHVVHVKEISEQYNQDQFEAISSNTHFLTTFKTEIDNLRELNHIDIENPSVDKILRRQIFIGVITSMETYLSDAFINTTLKSKKFTKQFVSNFHDFKNKSIPFNKLFYYHENVESICKMEMLKVIYHNLSKVKGMYNDTLSIEFGSISLPYRAVLTRHDLVHRNGKTKEGKEVIIDRKALDKLISEITDFIENIDKQLNVAIAESEQ